MKKKEKTLLIVLCVLVYAFVFVKFVVMASVPEIKSTQQSLQEAKQKKEALEADYRNLQNFVDEFNARNVADERLGSYLMDHAGLADSIEFIEKLALRMEAALEKVSLGQPSEMKEAGGAVYYGFPIRFSACFTYAEMEEMIQFCEGGSRKVRVAGFGLKPETEDTGNGEEQSFEVSMELVFYSLDKNAADNLYQFSLSKLQEFKDREGSPVFVREEAKLPETDLPQLRVTEEQEVTSRPTAAITMRNADFIVFHRGYLYGGYNFETYSAFNSPGRIRKTTAEPMDVLINLNSDTYTIQTTDALGRTDTVSGDIPARDMTLYIESNINNDVKENEKLQVNIKVCNDSGRDIRVQLEQTGGRVKLMDRNGNDILPGSGKEKLYL